MQAKSSHTGEWRAYWIRFVFFLRRFRFYHSLIFVKYSYQMMMDPKFNEYEQREAKNFILLDSSKEEFASSKYFNFIDSVLGNKFNNF